MTHLRLFLPFTVLLFLLAGTMYSQESPTKIEPKHYICYRTPVPLTIDGLLNEEAWCNTSWTDDFVDIEGQLKPMPRFRTRVKMLWDDNYLYIGAYLDEPHVWATLTERESVIFYDNDFEVFIDPDGDTHTYLEFEMNALNTQWDLLLLKPYRDDIVKNVAIDHWSYNGIKSAVRVDGTINNPNDIDKGWSLEIAIPLDALAEVSATGRNPVQGEQYRINFSRVEWQVEAENGKYRKLTHMVNGESKSLPEDNWVWSPQGVVNMHQPETWGFLQFSGLESGKGLDTYVPDPDNELRWAMRLLYYNEIKYFALYGKYSAELRQLGMETVMVDGKPFIPKIELTQTLYEATIPDSAGKGLIHITQDGRLWKTKIN